MGRSAPNLANCTARALSLQARCRSAVFQGGESARPRQKLPKPLAIVLKPVRGLQFCVFAIYALAAWRAFLDSRSPILDLVRRMPSMRTFAAFGIAVLCAGCAAPTRERAVSIATGEIANRKLPLPDNCTIRIGELVSVSAIEPAYKLWKIEFRTAGRGAPLYTATVDQRRRTVQDFTDHRRERTIPSHP